jgi:hypothetical protein
MPKFKCFYQPSQHSVFFKKVKILIQIEQGKEWDRWWYLCQSVSQEKGSVPVTKLTFFGPLADRARLKAEETR